MKTTFPKLRIYGTEDLNKPWEGWWSDGTVQPKWSSFFPASWTKDTLTEALRDSSFIKGGRDLGEFAVTKSGDTFYPWVNQTLTKAPLLKDMRKVNE